MNYFITETYLKTNTPITANVDVTDVTPYIATQAQLRIMPILGTTYYNYLLAAYNAQSLTVDEEALVVFIQPVIAWRSAEDAIFGLTYQLKNKGLQQQFGDFSTSVGRGEVAFGMEHYAQKASFFEQRLIRYLIANKALYPGFTDLTNRDTDLRPMIDACDCDCVGQCHSGCPCGGMRENGYNNSILIL
jgi:hypothetical protein